MKLRFICINRIDFAPNYKSNSKNVDWLNNKTAIQYKNFRKKRLISLLLLIHHSYPALQELNRNIFKQLISYE